MPNRIIKESICTSETIDRLSPFQETAFVRLIVNCDDFGRFFGNPKIVSSRLYPLRDVTPEEMENALETLRNVGLITRYVVDGKPYIQVNTWAEHQQTRAAKSKYPAVGDGQIQPVPGNCNQMISNDIKCSRYSYSINDTRNTITETGTEQTFKKFVAFVRIEFNAPFGQILNEHRSGRFVFRLDSFRVFLA